MTTERVDLATIQYVDLAALVMELHAKTGGTDWNGIGYVRELWSLAQTIASICGQRLSELEIKDARVADSRCSGVDLEAERTGKEPRQEQRKTGGGSVSRRNASKRHRSRQKVGTVGAK